MFAIGSCVGFLVVSYSTSLLVLDIISERNCKSAIVHFGDAKIARHGKTVAVSLAVFVLKHVQQFVSERPDFFDPQPFCADHEPNCLKSEQTYYGS